MLNKRLPIMGGYQSKDISPETQRLAETGVSDWLASRIEGLPPRAAPVESAPAAPASLASIGAKPAPAKPQLDLFPKAPEPVAPPAPPAPAAAAPPAPESRPPAAVLPLALPTKPVIMLATTPPLVTRRKKSPPTKAGRKAEAHRPKKMAVARAIT